jgi:2-haloacid dehalogenase
MEITDFKAMSFDCYGTLIDWETGILGALRPWLEGAGIAPGDDELLKAFAYWETEEEAEVPSAPYPEILEGVHLALARHYKLRSDPRHRQLLANSVGDWLAFDDTVAALKALKKHYKLIILSNVDRLSFARTNEKLGVEFDAIYTAEDIGTYKPHPRNFNYLLDHARADLGLDKCDILHTAQSLFHDHVPAKKFGITSCWIDRRGDLAGASKRPNEPYDPKWTFPTMQAFADAAT